MAGSASGPSLPFRLFLLLIVIGGVSIMVMMMRTASLKTVKIAYHASWFNYINILTESWRRMEAVVMGNETILYNLADLPAALRMDEELAEEIMTSTFNPRVLYHDPNFMKAVSKMDLELNTSKSSRSPNLSDCPDLPKVPSYVKPYDGWIPVHKEVNEKPSKSKSKIPITSDVNETHYIFQAYYDNRENARLVRVLSFSTAAGLRPLFYCQLWFTDPETRVTYNRVVRGEKKFLYRKCEHMYFPLFINCKVDKEHPIPYAVSIVLERCIMPYNILMVVDTTKQPEKKDNVGICVKPMNGPYQSSTRLVEFIEVNKMFGAEHLIIYDYAHNKSLFLPIIRHYVSRRVISVIPWSLPPSSRKIAQRHDPNFLSWIIRCGLIASSTDCLYRSMARFRYVAFVDMDEYIVPRSNISLKDMIRALPKGHAVYSFQNRLFDLDWLPKPQALQALQTDSRMFRYAPKTLMVTESGAPNDTLALKYIMQPKSAWAIRLHQPLLLNDNGTRFTVPSNLGLLHQYRFQVSKNSNVQLQREIDPYMLKFKESILSRIDGIFNKTRATVTL
ncbi:beta-1,4-galactosyltransferase galt-1 [Lingula anatina]|uniref:Glycosyltransferase family 92 protein n=1 Tax=Lingula anatina TaxID=7574 RepID=A0A1S3HNL1_LINAN|nr:beta-1,4-galactosyltransferase galt-1 [Lingula anatina]|eukprot:XP_013387643.1 beta-1,4-galactosyltransferase galt-1 [Lingula anatina]